MNENDALSQLKKAIISQKTAALPDRPPNPAFQPLHEQIVAYDRYVSETVIQILGDGREVFPYPKIDEVAQSLEEHQNSTTDGPDSALITLYRNYKNRLDRMLDLAMQVARSRAS